MTLSAAEPPAGAADTGLETAGDDVGSFLGAAAGVGLGAAGRMAVRPAAGPLAPAGKACIHLVIPTKNIIYHHNYVSYKLITDTR